MISDGFREHPEEFDRGLVRRGLLPRAEEILDLDRSWRAAETRVQEAQAGRNRLAREIGAAKKRGEAVEPICVKSGEDREAEAEAAADSVRLRARDRRDPGRIAESPG